MTPEERELIEETLAISKENNKILRSIRRSARLGFIMQICYWLIIVGISVGAYYFIQPYLEQLVDTYSGVQSGVMKVGNIFQ
jgi:hypothetical protein